MAMTTTTIPDRPLSLDITPQFPLVYPSDSSSPSSSSASSLASDTTAADNDVGVVPVELTPKQKERGRSPHSPTTNGGVGVGGAGGILVRTRASSLPPNRHRQPHPLLDTNNTTPPSLPSLGHYSLPASAIDSPSISIANSLQSSPGTSTSSLNVKFAPLPEIPVGRKRKNTTPLGVANRGAMMRKRRGLPMQTANGGADSPVDRENVQHQHQHQRPNGLWTHEEVEAHLRRQASSVSAAAAGGGGGGGGVTIKSPSNEIDDPLVIFGRKLKGVLRKVSSSSSTKAAMAAAAAASESLNEKQPMDKRIIFSSHEPSAEEAELEGGGVWEEEVSESVLKLSNNNTTASTTTITS